MAQTEKNLERYKEATPIKNDVLQNLIGSARILSASEIACALFIYRKTVGWKKKTDKISISQFTKALSVSKPTICKSLKTLRLVKICLLVKKGLHHHLASEWAFNENVDSWELVKKPLLVKVSKFRCKEIEIGGVKKSRPTKGTNIQKELLQKEGEENFKISSTICNEIIEYFKKQNGLQKIVATPEKRKQIRTRLKSFSVEEIKQAISNRAGDSFMQGENDKKTEYRKNWDSLFRNDEKVEYWLDKTSEKGVLKKQIDKEFSRLEKIYSKEMVLGGMQGSYDPRFEWGNDLVVIEEKFEPIQELFKQYQNL